MWNHTELSDRVLKSKIRQGTIRFGGNSKLKIYGKLNCKRGKRMLKQNRVFFASEEEAKSAVYRPCGHCLKTAYQDWKNGLI